MEEWDQELASFLLRVGYDKKMLATVQKIVKKIGHPMDMFMRMFGGTDTRAVTESCLCAQLILSLWFELILRSQDKVDEYFKLLAGTHAIQPSFLRPMQQLVNLLHSA